MSNKNKHEDEFENACSQICEVQKTTTSRPKYKKVDLWLPVVLEKLKEHKYVLLRLTRALSETRNILANFPAIFDLATHAQNRKKSPKLKSQEVVLRNCFKLA